MTLKNNQNKERNVKLLMKIQNEQQEFLIYQDIFTKKIYGGEKKENSLFMISEQDRINLDKILEKI